MSNTPNAINHRSPDSVTVTKRHMADALGYLMDVAHSAGLTTVVSRLAHVRASLLRKPLLDDDHVGDGKPRRLS